MGLRYLSVCSGIEAATVAIGANCAARNKVDAA